jgi:hypothetical protein
MTHDDEDDDGAAADFRSLGSYEGFELIASRQVDGQWRIMAVAELKDGEQSSADRTALAVLDPSVSTAEKLIRERIDRWKRMTSS